MKAIIFDLDNTIFPVPSIGEELFGTLFGYIEKDGRHTNDLQNIKREMMRRPFQDVAKQYGFSEDLIRKCTDHLSELTYNGHIEPFPDYHTTRSINCDKFLVTAGFTKLQWSKIEQLGIKSDFKEIIVIDPNHSNLKKKDIFKEIAENYHFNPEEVLIVGDDLNSEIKAGNELGMKTVLFDYSGKQRLNNVNVIHNYNELPYFID